MNIDKLIKNEPCKHETLTAHYDKSADEIVYYCPDCGFTESAKADEKDKEG